MFTKPFHSNLPQPSVLARAIGTCLVLLTATAWSGCGTTIDNGAAPGSARIRPASAGDRGVD